MAQSAPWGKPWQSHLPAHAMGCEYEDTCCRHHQSAQGTYETSHYSDPGTRNILYSHAMIQIRQVLAVRQQLRSATLSVPAKQLAQETVSETCCMGKDGAAVGYQWSEGGGRATAQVSPTQHWWRSTLGVSDQSGLQPALQVPLNMLWCSKHTQAGFYRKIF